MIDRGGGVKLIPVPPDKKSNMEDKTRIQTKDRTDKTTTYLGISPQVIECPPFPWQWHLDLMNALIHAFLAHPL